MPALKFRTTTSGIVGDEFILSDATVDHYGDSIDPYGWVLDNFSKNPIALFNHQSSFPIGNWTNLRVQDNALRGHLKMAPAGTSPRIDELRALREAGILKAVSVGFIPLSSTARKDEHGYRIGENFIKQELVETSLVSVPANPNALAVAKSLKISDRTMKEVFKQSETSSNAQRLRGYRRAIRKLKDSIARETNPKSRATWKRTLAHLEKAEREMSASLSPRPIARSEQDDFMEQCISDMEDQGIEDAEDVCQILWEERSYKQQLRARTIANIRRVDERLAREYAASPAGQNKRHQQETLANFTAQALKHRDPPKPVYDRTTPTWRGVKLPGLTWRGRKI